MVTPLPTGLGYLVTCGLVTNSYRVHDLNIPALAQYNDIIVSEQNKEAVPTGVPILSVKAAKNQEMMELLKAEVERNPETNLFSSSCKIRRELNPPAAKRSKPPSEVDFCEKLVFGPKTAEIIFPLSDTANNLVASYMDPRVRGNQLAGALKKMISASTKLWTHPTARAVLKFNDEIAAKVIDSDNHLTEYISLQYLNEHAPNLPVPKPHGLIKFSNVYIMFMTYIPSTTLESVWPNLTVDNKLSIHARLQTIFSTLRSMKMPQGSNLGGVGGEGVQDFYMDDHNAQQISTISAFEDSQFSVNNLPPSPAFVAFLRTFLPASNTECVFTHGDVRPANIMVEKDTNNGYSISGIIDWEMSGFYPEYVESIQVLHLFDRNVESDWYHYLPHCISPTRHPERFLVGRIWQMSLGFSAIKEDEYQNIK
ncbi:hypothetical protein PVAG01_00289 [Phlyctema vagabunda]|uniref:Aminoglycoside phosphotransferase domain-containing protein n=1 Tax=Phlyctema vagabunda TaxID=108571 RepID=A0ABR4PTV7_9HELO